MYNQKEMQDLYGTLIENRYWIVSIPKHNINRKFEHFNDVKLYCKSLDERKIEYTINTKLV